MYWTNRLISMGLGLQNMISTLLQVEDSDVYEKIGEEAEIKENSFSCFEDYDKYDYYEKPKLKKFKTEKEVRIKSDKNKYNSIRYASSERSHNAIEYNKKIDRLLDEHDKSIKLTNSRNYGLEMQFESKEAAM